MRGIPIFCKLNPHFHPRCASPEIMFQEAVRIVCNNAAPSAKTMGLHHILKKKKKTFHTAAKNSLPLLVQGIFLQQITTVQQSVITVSVMSGCNSACF